MYKNTEDSNMANLTLLMLFIFTVTVIIIEVVIDSIEHQDDFYHFLSLLNYDKWIVPTAESPVLYYLTSRPYHLVPLVVSLLSFMFFLKVIITGKCKIFKGITLLKLFLINLVVAYVFMIPLLIELILALSLVIGAFLILFIFFFKIFTVFNERFNKACVCKKKDICS